MAPAEDRMVVSEMGEMWAPYTAPARAEPTATRNSGSLASNTPMMMGRMSAIVPQLVPMANPMNAATRKMTAGRRSRPTPRPFRKPDTNSPVPSR